MAVYAIGDIQGCYLSLQNLLKRIDFNPSKDRLWLAGDLVNRGPRSIEVLRWAMSLNSGIISVLGNHDLHLLSRALGLSGPKRSDTLKPILEAFDREELLDWLRRRPLLHREGNFLLVHAGLHPAWTLQEAQQRASEVEERLRGSSWKETLREILNPATSSSLPEFGRFRETVKTLTRIRFCDSEGNPKDKFKGAPEEGPPGLIPWFSHPKRLNQKITIVCGHWAALGLRLQTGLIALDTGCVWGKMLTAVRLEDGCVFQEPFSDFK
jgi:bis(5'-nucleosyl)-tetraphosphatase (symmetrical)